MGPAVEPDPADDLDVAQFGRLAILTAGRLQGWLDGGWRVAATRRGSAERRPRQASGALVYTGFHAVPSPINVIVNTLSKAVAGLRYCLARLASCGHGDAVSRRTCGGGPVYYGPSCTLIREQAIKARLNDPCPCGSGKKYKKCCLTNDQAASAIRPIVVSPPPSVAESPGPDSFLTVPSVSPGSGDTIPNSRQQLGMVSLEPRNPVGEGYGERKAEVATGREARLILSGGREHQHSCPGRALEIWQQFGNNTGDVSPTRLQCSWQKSDDVTACRGSSLTVIPTCFQRHVDGRRAGLKIRCSPGRPVRAGKRKNRGRYSPCEANVASM